MIMKRTYTPGDRYNMLVLGRDFMRDGARFGVFKCDCGNTATIMMKNIHRGQRSCGCYRLRGRLIHGHCRTAGNSRAYDAWSLMKTKCRNPKSRGWPRFGGLGIKVCRRWLSFPAFFEDMGQPPEGMVLGRVDDKGPFNKFNCAWITRRELAIKRWGHQRRTYVDWHDRTLTLTDLAKETGIAYSTLYKRIRVLGWDVAAAVKKGGKP